MISSRLVSWQRRCVPRSSVGTDLRRNPPHDGCKPVQASLRRKRCDHIPLDDAPLNRLLQFGQVVEELITGRRSAGRFVRWFVHLLNVAVGAIPCEGCQAAHNRSLCLEPNVIAS